jgi:hypothetical protein
MTIKEILERAEDGDKVSLEATATFIGDAKAGTFQGKPWSMLRVGLTGDDGGQIYLSAFGNDQAPPPAIQKGDRLSLADVKVEQRQGKMTLKATTPDQVAIAGAGPPAERASTAAGGQRSQGGGGRPGKPTTWQLMRLGLASYRFYTDGGMEAEQAGPASSTIVQTASRDGCEIEMPPRGGDELDDELDDDPNHALPPDDSDIPF